MRFDALDLLSNDNEVQFSIINRLYAKRGERRGRNHDLGSQPEPLFRSDIRRRDHSRDSAMKSWRRST